MSPLLEAVRDLFFVARAGPLFSTAEGDGTRVGASVDEVISIAVSVTVSIGGGNSEADPAVGDAEIRSTAPLLSSAPGAS